MKQYQFHDYKMFHKKLMCFVTISIVLSIIFYDIHVTGYSFMQKGLSYRFSLYSEKTPPSGGSNNKLGNIYQYKGSTNINNNSKQNQPPAELAELLGIKIKKPSTRKTNKSMKNPPSSTSKSAMMVTGGNNNKKASKNKIVIEGTLEELEKQVLSKYGSNSYKLNAEEDWDEDEIEEMKPSSNKSKFQGFGSEASKQLYKTSNDNDNSYKKNLEETNEIIEFGDDDDIMDPLDELLNDSNKKIEKKLSFKDRLLQKKSVTTSSLHSNNINEHSNKINTMVNDTEDAYEDIYELDDRVNKESDDDEAWDEDDLQYLYDKSDSNIFTNTRKNEKKSDIASTNIPVVAIPNRSGPLQAISGFRLRPPPPIDPIVKMKADAKAAMIAEKEEIKKMKRAAKFEESKSQFYPFDFISNNDATNNITLSIQNNSNFFTTQSFQELGIKDVIVLRNLERMKLYNPTNIQSLAIPTMLQGKHVVLQAQTGSGKTLAFLLPLLNVVDPSKKQIQALIMAPSRELVTQIGHVATALFKDTDYRVVTLIGGANVRNQIKQLRENRPQIVVATPGRLAELVFRLEKIRLGMVRALVIDEVDNMMQDPYVGEIETILQGTPLYNKEKSPVSSLSSTISRNTNDNNIIKKESELQFNAERISEYDLENIINDTDDMIGEEEDEIEQVVVDDDVSIKKQRLICLASATSNDPSVVSFADRYCGEKQWTRVSVDSGIMLPTTITHGLISTTRMRALDMLRRFLNAKPTVQRALIFVNDPHRVEIIVKELYEMDVIAAPLHGDSSKDDRKEIIARIKDGRLRLVVTTELAARGLDIPDLTHVINFELPTDAQHYVHRAGRCGRAGKEGLVMNFANPETKFVIRRFGKKLGAKINDCEIRDGKVFLKSK